MKKLITASAILLSVLFPELAQANFSAVHKWTDSATQKTYIYFPGQISGQPVAGLTSPKAPKPRIISLNDCGVGKISKTTTPISAITRADGKPVNFGSRTNGSDPTCTPGVGLSGPFNSWSASAGDILETPTAYYIQGEIAYGMTVSETMNINVVSDGTITSKANACNFVRVTISATRPMTTFKVGATEYSLDSLPSVTAPMICKKVGTSSFIYLPAQN